MKELYESSNDLYHDLLLNADEGGNNKLNKFQENTTSQAVKEKLINRVTPLEIDTISNNWVWPLPKLKDYKQLSDLANEDRVIKMKQCQRYNNNYLSFENISGLVDNDSARRELVNAEWKAAKRANYSLELRRIPIRPHNFPVGNVASSSSSLHHEIKFQDKSRAFETSKPDNGQISKQIRDFIDRDCNNKCYYYTKEHLAPPHLKNEEKGTAIESDGKFQKKDKSYGNKVGAIFSAPQQPKAVDHEDDYDGGNDGLVILCADCNDSDDVDTDSADEDEQLNMYRVAHGFNISALEFQQEQQLMYGRNNKSYDTYESVSNQLDALINPSTLSNQAVFMLVNDDDEPSTSLISESDSDTNSNADMVDDEPDIPVPQVWGSPASLTPNLEDRVVANLERFETTWPRRCMHALPNSVSDEFHSYLGTDGYSQFLPFPDINASYTEWRDYRREHQDVIDQAFESWLEYQSDNPTALPDFLVTDPNISDSANEAVWQAEHWARTRISMELFFQGADARIFVGRIMQQRYSEYRSRRLGHCYYFEDIFPGFDLGGLSPVRTHEVRAQFAEVHRGNRNHDTITMSMDHARRLAIRYTHLGLMNFRFRRRIDASEEKLYVRLPRERWREYNSPTNLDRISWNKDHEGDDGAMDNQDGPFYPRMVPYHQYEPDPYQDMEDHLSATPPAADDGTLARTLPKDSEPGAQLAPSTSPTVHHGPRMQPAGKVVLTFKSGSKGPRPNCFNLYSLDNHAGISISPRNASLLANTRDHKAGIKASGIRNASSVSFTHVDAHLYCGIVILYNAPKSQYNLIATRVICNNGHHHYIVDKENLFYYVIMEKDNRMLLVQFDYEPADQFYQVEAAHAFDFTVDPNRKAKPPEETPIALINSSVIGAGDRQFESGMYLSVEQQRYRASLVDPIPIAPNHLSSNLAPLAAEALSPPLSLTNIENIVNVQPKHTHFKDYIIESKKKPLSLREHLLFSLVDTSNRTKNLTHWLERALLLVLTPSNRSHLIKVVVRYSSSSDHEAGVLFAACEESSPQIHRANNKHQVYILIDAHHEAINAERGTQTIRKPMRVKQSWIAAEHYHLKNSRLSSSGRDRLIIRNFISASSSWSSSTLSPEAIATTGSKADLYTGATELHGQHVLLRVKLNNTITIDCTTMISRPLLYMLVEIKGSAYRMRSNQHIITALSRTISNTAIMTKSLRQHLSELAERRSQIDIRVHMLEPNAMSTLEYNSADEARQRTTEERTDKEHHTVEERATTKECTAEGSTAEEAKTIINAEPPLQTVQTSLPPVTYHHPVAISVSARLRQQPPIMATAHNPSAAAARTIPSACHRKISSGNPLLPASRQQLQSPVLISNKAAIIVEVWSVSRRPEKAVNVKWSHNINNLIVDAPDNVNILAHMRVCDNTWDFVAAQIFLLDAESRTKHKCQVKYLKKSPQCIRGHIDLRHFTHIGTLSRSRTVKDQRDSREELPRGRDDQLSVANAASRQLFDEASSTTASTIDSALVTIQNKLTNNEACDVPSVPFHSHLSINNKGNKCVKLSSLAIHTTIIGTDPSAKRYSQPDGDSFITQLVKEEQCINLIEQDEPWKCSANGNKDGRAIAITTIALDFSADYFIRSTCKSLSEGIATRNSLDHTTAPGKESPLPLKYNSQTNVTSFLELRIQALHDCVRLFISQPSHATAVLADENCDNMRDGIGQSDFQLQPVFNLRTIPLPEEYQTSLEEGSEIILYRKETMFIAWMAQKCPNIIAAAVAHNKHTNCAAPRDINNKDDLEHYLTEFLANYLNTGMVIDSKNILQLNPIVYVGHATHEDNKGHAGCTVTIGKLGKHDVPLVWNPLNKQKAVSLSSTLAILIMEVSIMFDSLQCAHELVACLQGRQQQSTPLTVNHQQDNSTSSSAITMNFFMGQLSSYVPRRFNEVRYVRYKKHLDANLVKSVYLASKEHPADLLPSVCSRTVSKHYLHSTINMGTIYGIFHLLHTIYIQSSELLERVE